VNQDAGPFAQDQIDAPPTPSSFIGNAKWAASAIAA